ncbi:hypothetical protein V500_06230 [Pseudogymnoascus sp. VKM F-4518 (FW-2643)]|nr:hypothetical protein V500_06230 [Pseudogymnoascus sp. VKM F-4518 (FW-2643)]
MEFSPSQIIDWLQTCDRDHEGCYYPPDNNSVQRGKTNFKFCEEVQSNFRLIDVELECIKDARLGDRYIALSYICNLPSMFTMRKDNAELLYVEGYLERIRPGLPKTINDVIDLVKAIGEKYLWVDSLCLINDNEGDIALGIRIMNSVFQGSYFTIVAASGDDANAGLWGVVSDTKEKMAQQSPEVGIELKAMLSKSEYSKRGWTLQELTLSRRALIFVDNRVFFTCQSANWDETSSMDRLTSLVESDTSEPRICGLPGPLDGAFPSLSAYLELFEEYSRRELRHDGDALRAFYGLIRPLFGGMKTSSAEGLPAYYVNAFMLFTSPSSNLRRRHEFASFSWAGWAGELKWPRENLIWYDGDGRRTQSMSNIFKWLRRNEIAEWNQFSTPMGQGRLLKLGYPRDRRQKEDSHLVELLRELPQVFDSETVEDCRRYRDVSTCATFPFPSWDEEISEIENLAAASGTSKPHFCTWYMHPINCQAEFNRLEKGIDWGPPPFYLFSSSFAYHRCALTRSPSKFPDYSVLQTSTICLHLTLAAPKPASKPPRPLLSASGTTVGSLHPDNISLLPPPHSEIELIVLSRCQTPIYGSVLLGLEKEHVPTPGQPWDLLWVMHVEWSDGIAERRGIGQMLVKGLEDAVGAPEVKVVVLG